MKMKLILGCIVAALFAFTAGAQQLTDSGANAPGAGVIQSQLNYATPLGGGWGGGAGQPTEDYINNDGPPGQAFTLSANGTVAGIAFMGVGDLGSNGENGNAGGDISGLPLSIQIGTIAPDGTMTALDTESMVWPAGTTTAIESDWFTIGLAHPQNLTAGTLYYYSIGCTPTDTYWFGFSHSLGGGALDPTHFAFGSGPTSGLVPMNPGEYAPPGGSQGVFGPYAQPFGDRSSGGAQFGVNADYTYELLSVPEPGMITLLSLSGLALVVFRRRA